MSSGTWKRTQWTESVEAKAVEINKHKKTYWARAIGKYTCINKGCDRKTVSVCCNKCFNQGLKDLSRIPAYRAYVRQWAARDYESSRPSLLSYYPKRRGGSQ